MKKVVVILSFLAFASLVPARTVKLTMSDYQTVSISDKGFTVTAAKGNSATKPAYNTDSGDLRVYANGTLTVAAASENILSIEFFISTQGKERMPNLTVDTGEMTIVGDPDYTAVWNGNAQSVLFTVSAKAEFAKKTTNAGQLCFTAIRIVTDGLGEDDDDTPDLTKEYPLTQGRAFYWGSSAGCSNFGVEFYSEGIYFGSVNGEETIEGTGTYVSFDVFSDNERSFIGTYSTAIGADKVGGLAPGGISQWHVCGRGACVSAYIVSGSLTISCTQSGKYNLSYEVVDDDGNQHEGQALGITLQAFTENGGSYALSNVCTDADVDALPQVSAAPTIYVVDGQIVVNQNVASEISVYDLLGRCVARQTDCTQVVVPMSRGIYVVKNGTGVSKVVVK
ncbi:MAG: T9SS type A sorting domain-containing protein [Paludibacteraceae bacterium]